MLAAVFLLLGLSVIAVGIWFRLRPNVVSYVAERYNKRTAEWLARRGISFFLNDFDREVQQMRTFLPIVFILVGVGFCVFALQSL
jgi:uncharacterized membrane protein YczE